MTEYNTTYYMWMGELNKYKMPNTPCISHSLDGCTFLLLLSPRKEVPPSHPSLTYSLILFSFSIRYSGFPILACNLVKETDTSYLEQYLAYGSCLIHK